MSTLKRGDHAYRHAGVDYAALDAGKRLAVARAQETSTELAKRGGKVMEESRGEPAFVFEFDGQTLAIVLEGLGTKSIIARNVAEGGGGNHFDAVAYDTVAAIINDLCCVGARPLVANAYFSTGTPDWFARHSDWYEALVDGWFKACVEAGCAWGGGESPALPDLVTQGEIELAGSAVGVIPEGRKPIIGDELQPGNEIVLVASSGLHANGSSLARMIAEDLPTKYETPLPSGESFGVALLRPAHIYAELVESLLDSDVPVTYISHITGHGFLKLMRPSNDLTYRITRLPDVPEILEFLVAQAGMSPKVAYSTFNMGAGYAFYCAEGSGQDIVESAQAKRLDALVAGTVEAGPRRLIIEPLKLEYGGDELRLGPTN